MAILSRMFRLCKADLHGVMDQLEDKELLLKQYVREMEASLTHKGNRQAQLDDSCQKIQRDLSQLRSEVEKVEKDLDLSVRKDKDDIAKMLIRKLWSLQTTCEHVQRQLLVMEEEKRRVSEMLAEQGEQYKQLKVKADAFCRMAEQSEFEKGAPHAEGRADWQGPSETEIELALLQRKEALQKGGAP